MAFLDQAGERALDEAIAWVELRSRAELVVVIRPSSAGYLANDLLIGAGAAWAMLAFQLYAPPVFDLWTFLIAPPLFALGVIGLVRLVPPLRAMFVRESTKQDTVRRAAEACFFRKGIRHTRERTGILVYVSLFEQRVEVLADAGIATQVPEGEWLEAVARLGAVLDHGGDATELAERIRDLAEPLERWCERRADDVDELTNVVDSERTEALPA